MLQAQTISELQGEASRTPSRCILLNAGAVLIQTEGERDTRLGQLPSLEFEGIPFGSPLPCRTLFLDLLFPGTCLICSRKCETGCQR